MNGRRLEVTRSDVSAVYDGAGGVLWELLLGEQIHVGGEAETEALARRAGVTAWSHVLDLCSGLGGPARHLAERYGCRVTGLDATWHMNHVARRRTEAAGLAGRVTFRHGDVLHAPFSPESFDVVWGQDAWCYVTDKARLIQECARVVKPGGVVAFTDWLETGPMTEEEWQALHEFMVFPYMETLEGYAGLLRDAGLRVVEKEDLSRSFAEHMEGYLRHVRDELQEGIATQYGTEMVAKVLSGITLWRNAAQAGHVGRGRIVARKA